MAEPEWLWWRERRLPADGVHLDTAAAGRSSVATLAATAAHAEREAAAGGYVAAAQAAPVLAQGRAELARLLGVPPAGPGRGGRTLVGPAAGQRARHGGGPAARRQQPDVAGGVG